MEPFAEAAARIRQAEVGCHALIETPFGRRLLHYADLTATGRALDFVERFVDRLRSVYANTHAAVSTTGRIMSALREEARAVVARSVGEPPRWNRPIGRSDVDELVWFRYVETEGL
jgi:selenocysteine lyase/cysteine desulfurase